MEKYYRIGDNIFPAKLLFDDHRVRRLGTSIYIGSTPFFARDNEHAASRAFNRIVAIMGAEDLCAELAAEPSCQPVEERWKPEVGERYWAFDDCGVVAKWTWDDDWADRSYFNDGCLFRTREEAEAALAKTWEQSAEPTEEQKEPAVEERWKPEVGELYWTITFGYEGRGVIDAGWDNDSYDRKKFDAGIVFRTEEEAEAALAKMKERAAEERWRPEDGEMYYTLTRDCSEVMDAIWRGDKLDQAQFAAGLVFRAGEEAAAALAKMNNSA